MRTGAGCIGDGEELGGSAFGLEEVGEVWMVVGVRSGVFTLVQISQVYHRDEKLIVVVFWI